MQETELFIHSAEIAGVFVGFGALIAIRSGATMTTSEINAIRWVMTAGIWVVVVALAPAFIASYGLAAASSGLSPVSWPSASSRSSSSSSPEHPRTGSRCRPGWARSHGE